MTGPIGTRPAVVGLIAELKALTAVALPFLTKVNWYRSPAAGSGLFTTSCNTFEVGHVYSLDLDENVVAPSKRLYPDEVSAGTFLPLTVDVNKMVWEDNKINFNKLKDDEKFKLEHPGKFQHTVETNLIINTSCEHMDNTWFENIPSGRVVVLQTNDYFANEQHSNCCKDLAEAKAKYPMQSIMYEGELDTHLYNRFMLIGVK